MSREFDFVKKENERIKKEYNELLKINNKIRNQTEALKMLKRYNLLRNDFDAYLFAITEWGLGERGKPKPEDYDL